MYSPNRHALQLVLVLGLGGQSVGCSDSSVPSPFAAPRPDSGRSRPTRDAAVVPGLIVGEDLGTQGKQRDLTIGGACVDNEQCDDGFDCTQDSCHEDQLCRFIPDSTRCSDGRYCNGDEVCEPQVGCAPGEPVRCDDGTACTIDRCVEETRECLHERRDADGDGDPDANCQAVGGDCDDADPGVSSLTEEVCDNRRDDNCDGEIDEGSCVRPEFDVCDEPLRITGPGTYMASTEAAAADYASSCSTDGARDIAIAIEVAEEIIDVEISAIGTGAVALSASSVCGSPETETACEEGVVTPQSQRLSRLRLRGLGKGSHFVTLFTHRPQTLELAVSYLAATDPPENETCASATRFPDGNRLTVDLAGTQRDLASGCDPVSGDLVYFFDLAETQDVKLFATSLDGYSEPALSLRGEDCARAVDEISCVQHAEAQLLARALPPGRYTLGVAASTPGRVGVTLVTEAPTLAPIGDSCEEVEPIPLGRTLDVNLADFTDQVQTCLPGGRERVFGLQLPRRLDLLLVQRLSPGDRGAVTLAGDNCRASAVCAQGARSPIRLAQHGLSQGSFRVLAESELGLPATITALVREASPPELVAGASSCDSIVTIPEVGGYFRGSTANASPDFSSGCDLGGTGGKGAPDQVLTLDLQQRRRVVFDMSGSTYDTLLSVRSGDECPGKELAGACSVGLRDGRSFVDIELDAGRYFVQIDGFAGAKGQWALDVFVAEPAAPSD